MQINGIKARSWPSASRQARSLRPSSKRVECPERSHPQGDEVEGLTAILQFSPRQSIIQLLCCFLPAKTLYRISN
jgi:hypothetical protein